MNDKDITHTGRLGTDAQGEGGKVFGMPDTVRKISFEVCNICQQEGLFSVMAVSAWDVGISHTHTKNGWDE